LAIFNTIFFKLVVAYFFWATLYILCMLFHMFVSDFSDHLKRCAFFTVFCFACMMLLLVHCIGSISSAQKCNTETLLGFPGGNSGHRKCAICITYCPILVNCEILLVTST